MWGETHSGVLVDYEKNSILFDKIHSALKKIVELECAQPTEITGRIKDAGMLAGKISRCQTEKDLKTTQYEDSEPEGMTYVGKCIACGHDVVNTDNRNWHATWHNIGSGIFIRLIWTVCRADGCGCSYPTTDKKALKY
jgi:hypothetical protein